VQQLHSKVIRPTYSALQLIVPCFIALQASIIFVKRHFCRPKAKSVKTPTGFFFAWNRNICSIFVSVELFCKIRLCKLWWSSDTPLCFLGVLFKTHRMVSFIRDVLNQPNEQFRKIRNEAYGQNVEILHNKDSQKWF
jgi:hypothetical protein